MDIRVHGKAGERELLLSGPALTKVKAYLSTNPPKRKEALFRDHNGRPWTPKGIRGRLLHWSKKLGFRGLTPYHFRHAFLTALVSRLDDPIVIRLLGGYRKIESTWRYISHYHRWRRAAGKDRPQHGRR